MGVPSKSIPWAIASSTASAPFVVDWISLVSVVVAILLHPYI
ncbi:hypothetical protein [Fischerella sp. NIES-3754]|nr:hypothetical protein [Fischerella sp. NIES-3754]